MLPHGVVARRLLLASDGATACVLPPDYIQKAAQTQHLYKLHPLLSVAADQLSSDARAASTLPQLRRGDFQPVVAAERERAGE